jgi:hypothetical protein
MQALDDAVALGPADPGGLVLDALQLEEQLVGMLIRPAAELAAIVRQYDIHASALLLEGRQDLVVEGLDRRDRQLVGIQARPSVAGMAVDRGLQIDLAHALEHTDEEGVHRDERARMWGLDVPFAELGTEPFEQPRLLRCELDRPLGRDLLQPQQALVLGQQVVAAPDATHAARADLQPA